MIPALCAGAQRFCAAVAADPGAPMAVAVIGPDGYGRAHVAAALRATYEQAGARVLDADDLRGGAPGDPGGDTTPVALVVEDAHLLDDAALAVVAAWAQHPGARVVVTHRGWPRPRALAEVMRALPRRPVVLEELDRPALSALLSAALGEAPAADPDLLLDVLEREVAGVPALVDQVLANWRAQPQAQVESAASGSAPARVTERLAQDLALLDDDAHALLVALAVGAPSATEAVAAAGTPPDSAEEARAAGLLLPGGIGVPIVRRVLLATTSPDRLRALRVALLRSAPEHPVAALVVARELAAAGEHEATAAAVLLDAAQRSLAHDPATAAELFGEAIRAGAPRLAATARRAEATALAGRSEDALLLADEVLAAAASADDDDVERSVVVAATVLAHRALLPRSAQLYRWSAAARAGRAAPLAVLALVGVGDREQGEAVRSAAPASAPTLVAGASALMADGVLSSLDDAGAARALGALTSASAMLETSARAVLLPDTPAALAALVALHSGDVDSARAVLARAIAGGQGGPAAQPRHHLLLGWTALLDGKPRAAAAHVADARGAVDSPLEPREALVLAAMEVGLARRGGDVAELAHAWARARQQLLAAPVDLFALLPLGELAVGAARLGERARVEPHLIAAHELLDRLGGPALWSAPLLWSEVQSAVLAEDTGALRAAADRLRASTRAADAVGAGIPLATAASAAAAAWVGVLEGTSDAAVVESASRALAGVGLAWDASRLAGQAAVRTSDRRAMTLLLQVARSFTSAGAPDPDAAGHEPGAAAGAGAGESASLLSDREREVAVLVVAGNTYREVGAQLFLSPKTVEHHVARLRQRLGAQGRTELLGQLRTLLEQSPAGAGH